MREPEAIANARCLLGRQLAACRRVAGLSQAQLAEKTGFSRSTIANVETGRQHAPGEFWESADTAVSAGGSLVSAHEKLEKAARRARAGQVQVAGAQGPLALPVFYPAAQPLPTAIPGTAAAFPAAPEPDVVAAAAAQARDHAMNAAATGVGPGTVEQLTAEVVRLGRAYVAGTPLPLFAAMHETLGRVQTALGQKAYPAQARDLSFLAGALCGLMANASLDLGREDAADDLARAAWTYGTIIDNAPLIGWARGTQALAGIWDHRYADAAQYAGEGLSHLPAGMGAARLHAIRARALAGHRDFAQARAAIKAAAAASNEHQPDQLHNGIAGEFAFDTAKLRYYEALVLARAGYPADAETAAAAAVSLYQAAPDTARSYGCEALAHVQLATARLMSGNADAAAEAIAGLLRLDPGRRISSLHEHVEACRELLRGPAYRGSRTAAELGQQLAVFSAVSITSALPSSR
ncbi:MAG TPA: helix-turn-helix transcriptional regulator [Streptosporangiaceae bacterium]|nr:helix-turn-helix transcriptional regulator [Streptosporangiaceae bacterium]